MTETESIPSHFFAWAYSRALTELEARVAANPELDRNWTFSDIMQELLVEYRRQPELQTNADRRPERRT